MVFAIVGISGNVGGHTADFLLQEGKKVRGVVRDEKKGGPWKEKGVEIAIADLKDEAALTKAFTGVEGVFILVPPHVHSRAENLEIIRNLIHAITNAKVKKVVYLSSIGSHLSSGTGPIIKTHDLENEIFKVPISTAGLRAASFYENILSQLKGVQECAQYFSFYSNPDWSFAQVATKDIGRVAASTLSQEWDGHRIVDVYGPKKYSIHEVVKILSTILGKDVTTIVIPPENYFATYKSFGLPDVVAEALTEMHHGFNTGNLVFGGDKETEDFYGTVTYEEFFTGVLGKK